MIIAIKIIMHPEIVLTLKVSPKNITAKIVPNTDSSESIREAVVGVVYF